MKFKSYLLLYIAVVFVAVLTFSFPIENVLHHFFVFVNAEIATVELFAYRRRPFSMHKVVNLFIFFFFVIANSVQYISKNITSSIYYYKLDDNDYLLFQILVFVILVVFNIAYSNIRFSKKLQTTQRAPLFFSSKVLVLLSVFSFALVLYMNRGNLMSLFLRGITDSLYVPHESDTNLAGGMLFSVLFKSTPYACFIFAAIYNLPKKTQWLLFLILLLDFFPTGVARMTVASVYLPVLLIKSKYLWKKDVFVSTMIVGILFVFPFLNIFRYIDRDYTFEYSLDFLNQMHFDASQEFMIVMKEEIVTNGKQLLGCILFWVPRSFWGGKPGGSSFLLADRFGEFPNISMPFFAEGYINFGYIGIILFTLLLAYLCSRFDFKFWYSTNLEDKRRFAPFYFLIISQLLLTLRGDLMSGTAYIVGGLFNLFLIYKIAPYMSKIFTTQKK